MPKDRRGVPAIPVAEPPALPSEIVIETPVIVGADWHVPHHDRDMILRLCGIAQRDKIKTLILGGDFLTLDAFWMGGVAKRPTTTEFRTELAAGKLMIRRLLEWFETIYYLEGNHENRLFRVTNGEIDMGLLKAMLLEGEASDAYDRLIVTDRDYVVVKHGFYPEDVWRVTHGQGGSASVATNAAISKADSYNCNVLQGHNHLWGARQTKNGLYLGVDTGCLMDPSLAEYKVMRTNTYPMWVRGFSTLRNGKVRSYADRYTDWETELPNFPRWSARVDTT